MSVKHIAHNSLLPFYLAWQLEPNTANYHLNFSYRLKSRKAVDLLIEKLQELVRLKAYLRQTFSLENETLMVSFHEELPPQINFHTCAISDLPELEQALIKSPHDLNQKSPIQLHVVNLDNGNEYMVLFNIHHIVMERPTLDRFITDLNCLLIEKKIEEESIEDYFVKLGKEKQLQEEIADRALIDYLYEINNIAEEVDYPIAKNKKAVSHYKLELPLELTEQVHAFSDQQRISVFNLFLVSFSIFSAKLFDQKKMLINYPVDIRENKILNGCFVNIVTFPLVLAKEDTYLSVISNLKLRLPILKCVSKFKIDSKINGKTAPSFSLLTAEKLLKLQIGEMTCESRGYPQIANANISMKYQDFGGELHFVCDILEGLFSDHFSVTLINRFFYFINKLINNASISISNLDLTFEDERKQILLDFSGITYVSYLADNTICQCFFEQVEKNPDAIAVCSESQTLSYRELDGYSNQLGATIREKYLEVTKKTFEPDTLIALCVEPGIDMIVGMLGILKARGAYLPISPAYARKRINFILKDAHIKFILLQENFTKKAYQFDNDITQIMLDGIFGKKEFKSYQFPDSVSNNLAYAMYTSGTTGAPKGVMIEHRNVVSLVKEVNYFTVNNTDTFLLLGDVGFDASTFEIWGALLNGARLFIPKNRLELLSDKNKFKNLLKDKRVTILFLTTRLFDCLIRQDDAIFKNLKYLMVGGEILNKTLIDVILKSHHKPQNLLNIYGPTENTTFSCAYFIEDGGTDSLHAIPIGIPVSGKSAFVLDQDGQPLPIGVTGELYVGGCGLARCYLNQPTLTQERFIENSLFSDLEQGHERLYKTGDLVRWLEDGNLEYIGRRDCQVKISGYRVELGEIESILSNYPGITQVAVLSKEKESDRYLIAYFSSKTELNEDDIFQYLKENLPDHMIPSLLVSMPMLPLNENGKLNRATLPETEFINGKHYAEPTNAKEELICQEISKTLGLKKIGLNDDFFRLGGNSIKAIALVSRLQTYFSIRVGDIFDLRTPKRISEAIFFEKDNLVARLQKIKLEYKRIGKYDD